MRLLLKNIEKESVVEINKYLFRSKRVLNQ